MTEKEAIYNLKHCVTAYEAQNPNNLTCDLTWKTLDIAVKALEKQIPKKPIKSKEQKIRYVNTYYCPTCNLGFTGFNIAKWCYHCGQKLDWSDEE